ncbi:CPBP family intramembrane glutamic endopeptidase [Granulicoccus phenolivorans]|uniref:CPBP family intramembrane glutamic endopeptidase n=1 Tax=Granulicoccus phenolivorans TaxID=266854 RepID=UPI00040DB665|nr:CPBP family intramembrane glutamic endopeptidase [Granulicoccus phenolivorans]
MNETVDQLNETVEQRPRWLLGVEVVLVLGVSLGRSAVYAILSLIDKATQGTPLNEQTTTLNTSQTPDRPWLDLAYQLAGNLLPLVPVALAFYLLAVYVGPRVWDLRRGRTGGWAMGFDLTRRRFDLGWGFVIAAGIGVPGLLFYLAARDLGFNTQVQPANLAENWWTIPVYVLNAAMNGIVEEVLVVGYLFIRLRQLGWSTVAVLFTSALVRGSYHLYQGVGAFFGNVVMGLAFGLIWLRWKRVGPLVVAHTLIDIVAFVGSALLAGSVSWL